ncbi:uncharacterized protein LY89DRAFT_622073 [Mollisia scopiformis]|uniref:Uncharacterized protein n=1 Tax=Mollisia scopiformis TaxID=149040 RepID=A0A194X077_MOLSC|nr:uncharacterized protein LY89DRAFT_622073 [Mollisia scopiformis]KUJ13277.1 hypothetical protein LY89DRAFT_622073 [Mollisia scopiformis]
MSKVRGIFPLFLATTFGIVNGIWVFGPAFREQQENDGQVKTELVVSGQVDNARVEQLRDVEAAINRASANKSILQPAEKQSSWWTTLGDWSRGSRNDNTREMKSATPNSNIPTTPDRISPTNVPTSSPTLGIANTPTLAQKLVEKAAEDPDLKMLLKTVAEGGGSSEELKKFQRHLDDIERE